MLIDEARRLVKEVDCNNWNKLNFLYRMALSLIAVDDVLKKWDSGLNESQCLFLIGNVIESAPKEKIG